MLVITNNDRKILVLQPLYSNRKIQICIILLTKSVSYPSAISSDILDRACRDSNSYKLELINP